MISGGCLVGRPAAPSGTADFCFDRNLSDHPLWSFSRRELLLIRGLVSSFLTLAGDVLAVWTVRPLLVDEFF